MKPLSRDTTPEAHEMHVTLLREAGPERRFGLLRSLTCSVVQMSRSAVQRAYPRLQEREAHLQWVAHVYGRDWAEFIRRCDDQRGTRAA